METKGTWKRLICLGLATIASVGAMAQGGTDSRHKRHDGARGNRHHYEKFNRRNLSDKVYHITHADSVQKAKKKPSVDHATKRLETLRASYQKQEKKTHWTH
jgi:hypothetical protein